MTIDRMDAVVTDAEVAGEKEEKTPQWKPRRHEWMVMITLATISLMVALDATILVPVLPTLSLDLHGTTNDALWTGTSYLLTSAVFQPFIAALSDIFGRRELLLPSLLLFTAGTAGCCAAHGFTLMLVGRCVQGVGGGGIITSSQIIFTDIVPLRQRPKYFSVVLGAWALGTVVGPFIGGLLVEKTNWRWCFYINFPFCAIGFPMVLFLIPLRTAKTTLNAKLLRVDWLGGLLFVGGLTSFLVAITWGGVQLAWTSWRVLVPLAVGLAVMFSAIAWERYGATEPFLPHCLFHTSSAIAAYVCALLQGLLLFTALYYLPFYLTSILSKSPIQSGLNLFPATCLVLPGSAVVSILITRLGHFRIFAWLGWIISTVGAGLLILLDEHTRTWYWALALAIFGLGMGMILSSVNFATQANANLRDAGRAAACYAFMRSLGMAIGVAVSGSVFQNLMSDHLQQLGLETSIAKDAEAFVPVLRRLEATNPAAADYVLGAYLQGFFGIFVLMAGLSGLGLAMSLCIKHKVMDKRLESQHTLDRTSRTSKFLESGFTVESVPSVVSQEETGQRESQPLREDHGTRSGSRVTFSDEVAVEYDSAVVEFGARVSQTSHLMVEDSSVNWTPRKEVVRNGAAKAYDNEGPIWGVS